MLIKEEWIGINNKNKRSHRLFLINIDRFLE